MEAKTTAEFDNWLDDLNPKTRALVDDRLDRLRHFDHFGDSHDLDDGLFELRWKSGMRVYFGYVAGDDGGAVLLLLGGDKHGQNRDIRKARSILAREAP